MNIYKRDKSIYKNAKKWHGRDGEMNVLLRCAWGTIYSTKKENNILK